MEKCTSHCESWFRAIERGHEKYIRKNFGYITPVDTRVNFTLGNVEDNETPITLALKSNMRDTVQKLVLFGAYVPSSQQNMVRQYVHRGIVPKSMKNSVPMGKKSWQRNQDPRFASPTAANRFSIDKHLPAVESQLEMPEQIDLSDACCQTSVNQLQFLSTDYDLELAREKRELVRKIHNSRYSHFIACMAPADVSTEIRLKMVSLIFKSLQLNIFIASEEEDFASSVKKDLYGKSEPYLRLIEACLCESHCSSALARELSHLSLAIAFCDESILESKGSSSHETNSCVYPAALSFASYVKRLLHKLLSKTNSQYRSGILAHLIRIFTERPTPWMLQAKTNGSKKNVAFWSEVFAVSSSLLENLVRLGETLDQSATISRFAQLVGLIGQNLLECDIKLDHFTPQFTELADILVGLSVDTTSITRGICLQSIYTVISDSLAGWWLVPPMRPSVRESEDKSVTHPVVNVNMSEMLYHLLEDSENAMNASLTGCFVVNSNRPVQSTVCEISRDSAQSLIYIRLYTSMLAEIIEGVISRPPMSSNYHLEEALSLTDSDLHKWIDRLLRLAKAAHTCHRAVHSGGGEVVGWHNTRSGNTVNNPRTPFSVVDGIEQSIFQLLAYFVATPHGSDMCQYLEAYVTNRVSDSTHIAISSKTLRSLLNLICNLLTKFSAQTSPHPILSEALLAYFSAPSILNSFKLSSRASHNEPPLSVLVYNALYSLCSAANLRDAICRMSWVDFRVAISLMNSEGGKHPTVESNCEVLGTFSLSLLSSTLKFMSHKEKVNCQKYTVEVLINECSTCWTRIPTRLRISVLAFFNVTDNAIITTAQLLNFSAFVSGLLSVKSTSPLEQLLVLNSTEKILSSVHASYYNRRKIFIDLVTLARRFLHCSHLKMVGTKDNFVHCVRILITYCFADAQIKDDDILYSSLFRLSELACSHACKSVNTSGSDLYLALAAFRRPELSGAQLLVQPFRSQFAWYVSRQPDSSTTSLLSPANRAHRGSGSDGSALTVSSSAYPSLPAIAGLLGILTRGAPCSLKTQTSRLKLLQEPQDWLHRLSQLISPIPSDMRASCMSHPGDSVAPVLWYAAWSMADYKLKVAPWAKPVCTFLSIEGSLRALLQSYSNRPDQQQQTGQSSISIFHRASSKALSRQSCSRQLWQSHMLILFIQFLERTIQNAVSGFAVALPRPPLPACTFFSANVSTCTQWFNRVRFLMLRVADGWPVVLPKSVSLESSAITAYNSYALLDTVGGRQSGGYSEWCSHLLAQQTTPGELIVRLAKALLRLSAWEDLEALADWTDGFKLNCEVNPFGWLRGVTALARCRWDDAVDCLQKYVNAVLKLQAVEVTEQSSQLTNGGTVADNDRASTTEYTQLYRAGLAYASNLLLQYYLNVGDFTAYDSLQSTVNPEAEPSTTGVALQCSWSPAAPTVGHLSLSSARLQCFRRLATWTAESPTDTELCERESPSSDPFGDTSDVSSRWCHSTVFHKLDDLLYDTALPIVTRNQSKAQDRSSTTSVQETLTNVVNLGRLVKIIRTISKPGITTCSMTMGFPLLYFTSTDLAESDDCLTTWLTQCNQLIDLPPSEGQAVDRHIVWSGTIQSNSVRQATWRHLIIGQLSDINSRNCRLNATIQACRWACDNENPNVSCQLLMRELQPELQLFETSNDQLKDPLRRLYHVLSNMLDKEGSQHGDLSRLHRLLLSRCVSQTLWMSSGDGEEKTGWLKLAAIDLLSLGLRNILTLDRASESSSSDRTAEKLTLRCDLSTDCALQLFDWLERRPGNSNSPLWVDSIGQQQKRDERTSGGMVDLKRIARNLNFFSQLVDVPWCHGLPVGTPAPQESSYDHGSSYQSWTSRLLMMSTRLSPTGSSSVAWLRMADWCYARGQASIDDTQVRAQHLLTEVKTATPPRPIANANCPLLAMLQPDECQSLMSVMPHLYPNLNQEEREVCLPYLLAALSTFLVSDDNRSQADSSGETTFFSSSSLPVGSAGKEGTGAGGVVRCQPKLRLSPLCPDETTDLPVIYNRLDEHVRSVLSPGLEVVGPLPHDVLTTLQNIVQLLVHRRYSLHTSAAQAYATYLSVAEHQSNEDVNLQTGRKPRTNPSRLDTFNATLKLLDLLSAPSRALRDMIAGFLMQGCPTSVQAPSHHQLTASTTTLGGPSIWEACLPQVVVRLNLPDHSIRQCLISLLSRLIMTGNGGSPNDRIPVNSTGMTSFLSSRFAARLVFPAVVAATGSNPGDATITATSRPSTADRQRPSSCCSTVAAIPALPDPPSTRHRASETVSQAFGHQLLASLHAAGFTGMVHQVETFVGELQRLTLLWEELWLGTLTQHLDELVKKMHLLEGELKRPLPTTVVTSNQSTQTSNGKQTTARGDDTLPPSLEPDRCQSSSRGVKTSPAEPTSGPADSETSQVNRQLLCSVRLAAAVQPTLAVLDQLIGLTLVVPPQTPHEQWFQKTFGPVIAELRESFVTPTDAESPLLLMRQFIHKLQSVHTTMEPSSRLHQQPVNVESKHGLQAPHQTGAAVAPVTGKPPVYVQGSSSGLLHLSLSHLSPRLARMHFGSDGNNPVQMCSRGNSPVLSVRSSSGIPLPGRTDLQSAQLINRVAILPTKTRPKRLLFRAQDGHTYSYLLKGLEDLRLDDRIMRLYELITSAARVNHGSCESYQPFVRTYAVTPLGVRAGLLQMVQGAAPLFYLYKRWQLRTAADANKAAGVGNTPPGTTVSVPRPGELFHSRLKELMQANGFAYQASRSSWPIHVLRDVLSSLESETPADLLSRELWAVNPTSASWWQATQMFSRSAGLMSGLGYLVGLGDRHLDNLLVDMVTGHMIHIDYNVCFEKGRSLRVAERVPFRLTRIIRRVLGPLAQNALVRGNFRIAAEDTLQAARNMLDPVLIQLNAFLIDPLVDWQLQTRKTQVNTSSSIPQNLIPELIHLSAYYGGGSSDCPRYRSQRLHRIAAELHLYTSLVATRIVELVNSSELVTAQNCLDDMVTILSVWTERRKADHLVTEWNRYLSLISAANQDDFVTAQLSCNHVESAEDRSLTLQKTLFTELSDWRQQFLLHRDIFSHLTDSLWLSSVLESQSDSVRRLVNGLNRYNSIARVYLTHPHVSVSNLIGDDSLEQLYNHLSKLGVSLLGQESLTACRELVNEASKTLCIGSDEVLRLLRPVVAMSNASVSSLRAALTELTNNGVQDESLGQAIQPELDNLRLFLYDQRSFGMSAYCWALLYFLPNFIGDTLALESQPKYWECRDDEVTTDAYSGGEVISNLSSLTFMTECLVNLFSVLQNQSLGVFHFTAGYEADVRREVAFMLTVRDAIYCVNQLHSNLVRLLLLQATEAVVLNPDGDLIKCFSNFLVHHMAESDTSRLKDFVGDFLMHDCLGDLVDKDSPLRQVLIAVHLALVNTTAQMEEIAHRMKQYPITAAAWYYVDIVAQPTETMLNRSSDWRTGATSLWGWTAAPTVVAAGPPNSAVGQEFMPMITDDSLASVNPTAVTSISWTDEVYANGLMAFVSVLEEARASWISLFPRPGHASTSSDYCLAPFSSSIQRFISRLVSRLALPSLLGLAAGRLFCCLIEDSGNPISRLLMQCRVGSLPVLDPLTGLPVPIILSAEKLTEAAGDRLAFSQPVEVQQLRSPAGTLISRMSNRANLVRERMQKTIELEAAERHHYRLSTHLTAIQWMLDGSSSSNEDAIIPTLSDTLASLQQDLDELDNAVGDNSKLCDADQLVVSLARAISFMEGLRLNRLSLYCTAFCDQLHPCLLAHRRELATDSLVSSLLSAILTRKSRSSASRTKLFDLVQQLQSALTERQTASANMTTLATALINLKTQQPGGEVTHRSLPDQLQHELAVAKKRAVTAQRRISQSKRKLLSLTVLDTGSTGNLDNSSSLGNRTSNKTKRSARSVSYRPDGSVPMTSSSQSQRLGNLRGALTSLQCGRLTDLRQLIKLVARLHAMQDQLTDDLYREKQVDEGRKWTVWLEDHQTWTSDVLQVLKQVNRLIHLLEANAGTDAGKAPRCAGKQQLTDKPGSPITTGENSVTEPTPELAIRLHRDCLKLCHLLWARLVSPLFHTVEVSLTSGSQLAGLVASLLSPMYPRLLSAVEQAAERLGDVVAIGDEEEEDVSVNENRSCPNENQQSPIRESVINSQALAVWHRLRDRCLGIDPHLSAYVSSSQADKPDLEGEHHQLPVSLHVDACIRAATDVDNLALMYEGWTAWV